MAVLVIGLSPVDTIEGSSEKSPSLKSAAEAPLIADLQPVTLRLPAGASIGRILPGQPAQNRDQQTGLRKAETTLLTESFEGSWPAAPWSVSHGDGAVDVVWGRTKHRASLGSHSIWCARSGSAAPGTGKPVPVNTNSWAVAGPFDLTEAKRGTLTFDLWLQTEQFHDLFMWLVSTDGESFSGDASSTDTDGWKTVTVDLTNWGDEGDVTGYSHVWIALVYQTDHQLQYEGAYVDNLTLVADSGSQTAAGFTYTRTSHFELGTVLGTKVNDGSLQLSSEWSAPPYIWVPSSTTGTVSKVSTETVKELARYRTGPDIELDLEPSPVAVDLHGNAWVGNRGAGTVIKIGLPESNECVDRNGNGIETSSDNDDNGDITEDEILDWGADECVLFEVLLAKDQQETYVPGEEHDGYESNDLRAIAVDAESNVWVGVSDSAAYYQLDGTTAEVLDTIDVSASETHPYSAVIDRSGTLWSASWPDEWVLRIDPATGEATAVDLTHPSCGLAIDGNEHLFVTGKYDDFVTRIDTSSEEEDWRIQTDWDPWGVTVTSEGDFWIAAAATGNVRRYSNNGFSGTWVPLANEPTGLSVDSAGKVWATGPGNSFVIRLNQYGGAIEDSRQLLGGGGHDAIGDMTGNVARNLTTRYGVWTVAYDSRVQATAWGTISWQGDEPEGTSIKVRVRSSEDEASWSGWEQAANGVVLQATPAGRFLRIEAALQMLSGETSPVLEELTVSSKGDPPEVEFYWTPSQPIVGQTVQFSDASSNDATSWAWDFGDGELSEEQNPSHQYSAAGTYTVTLEASNDQGSASTSKDLTVTSGLCQLTCTATVPDTGEIDETVAFVATAERANCTGEVAFAWLFGDGGSSFEQNPSHIYNATGIMQWTMTASVEGEICTQSGDIAITGNSPEACTSVYWVPVVSHADGLDSVWRSDLGLLGIADQSTSVELRFHTPDSVATTVISVGAQASINLSDVVALISPGADVSGALEVCAEQPVIVTSRTYNQLADDAECLPGGSFGQRLDGVESSAGLSTADVGLLPQLRESSAFRTNIGFVNTGTETAEVQVTLLDAGGAELVVYTIDLEPGIWKQDNRPFLERADRADIESGWARIEVTTGNGVLVYASVIDRVTGDATTVEVWK
jgi:PKD repeat protein